MHSPSVIFVLTARVVVQAQKFSIQKQLRKRFQRFMVSSSDYNNLLLTVLRGMAREVDRLDALTRGDADYEAPAEVSVDKTRFEERAQVPFFSLP